MILKDNISSILASIITLKSVPGQDNDQQISNCKMNY